MLKLLRLAKPDRFDSRTLKSGVPLTRKIRNGRSNSEERSAHLLGKR
jgi:hypothetical protein